MIIAGGATAEGKDLSALAGFVAPAYTAMNFAVMCSRDNPSFLLDTSGPRGTALHYAEHVKDEAIDGLSDAEALKVLKSAADSARSIARRRLHQLAQSARGNAVVSAIKDWCEQDAKQFIVDAVDQHDAAHADVLELLRRAKQ